ncbi:MAG: acetate--CoA ligase family protein [Hyphomicrobiales bacterium]|nr:acetate--CoA ligase family protein [Hyphomicrobiales bacterium]
MVRQDPVESLRPLLQARTIAIVGASRTPGKSGHSVLENLLRGGYPGRIFPVNPSANEIEGITCFPSVKQLPERADCAFLVIPAKEMVQAIRDCSDAGVRSVVVAASGFAETGEAEDVERQATLADIARASGIRMLGPNTNGVLNTVDRMQLGYNSEYREQIPSGTISMVSHSGALFSGIARSLRRFGAGLCKFIPVGNEADIDMLDLLEFLIRDDTTRVIGLVVEGIRDGARLRALASEALAAGKPIVALKVGRSSTGVEATLAHSSRLAGSARAYDALFDACNIATVRSVEGLAGGCALLAGRSASAAEGDQRLVCVTTSGAGGALLCDFAEEHGFLLAGDPAGEWEEPAASIINALPARGRIRNPIDMGSLDPGWLQLPNVFAALEKDGLNGPVAVYTHVARRPSMDHALTNALIERQNRTGKPTMIVAPGTLVDQVEAQYREGGIAVFHDIATGFESLNCHYSTLPRGDGTAQSQRMENRGTGGVRSILESQLASAKDRSALTETASAEILRAAGVPVVASTIVQSVEQAMSAAADIGFPVVCKALAPGVAHKNEHGFVIAGISNAQALKTSLATLEERIARSGFNRADVPIVLQPMIRAQVELILGVNYEPGLGHFLVAGLGGIYTEAFDEVTLFAFPSPTEQIQMRLAASRVGRILSHLKGSPDALRQTVQALAALQVTVAAAGDMIDSIDVNPFLVGDHCIAVDALIVPKTHR